MEITKRNGFVEKFNIEKIRIVMRKCASYINDETSQYLNIIESKLFFKNENITTKMIQEAIIHHTIELFQNTNDIVYSKLATQFILYNIDKNFKKKFNLLGVDNINIKTYIEYLIGNGDYDKTQIGSWNKNEWDEINKICSSHHNNTLLISQILFLCKKYLRKDNNGVYELPHIANIAQAMCICKNSFNRMEKLKQIYEAISTFKISLATPIKCNLRNNNNFTSCYIIEAEDDTNSILDCIKKCAIFSKNGGGVGIYLGKLRPSNSYIKGVKNANNINKWVKIFDVIAPAWNQNGVRNGAFTVSLDVFHKDIFSFIECKTESGGDVNEKCFNIFPQIIINKQFINEVINDGEFPLLDRYVIQQQLKIDICNLDEYNTNYEKIKTLVKDNKIENCLLVKAKDLWKKILQTYVEVGELYIVHKDNINKTNPLKNAGYFVNGANLCIESFTPINQEMNHSCNLISLNMGIIELEDFEHYCSLSVFILNELIKFSNKIFPENKNNIQNINPIGIGLMGVADYMAKNNLSYVKDKIKIEVLCEMLAFYSLKASIDYNKENNGKNPALFSCSNLSEMKFLGKNGDELNKQGHCGFNWEQLLTRLKNEGCANLYLNAIAPNTSTSVLCNASSSYIPIFNDNWVETFNNVNVFINKKFENKNYELYKNIDATHIIELTNSMCKWIDAGISMELILNENTNVKQLSDCLLKCFQDNLKGMYYCRTQKSPQTKIVCVGCEN